MTRIANLASSDVRARDAWNQTFHVCALAGALATVGCSSVSPPLIDARAVSARVQPLRSAAATEPHGGSPPVSSPESPAGPRFVLLELLREIHRDFGTTLTPRQLANRLQATARSESPGTWVFDELDSPFVVDANAMSLDSPVDWLRVTIRAELAIHLGDLTKLFSNDYTLWRGGAEFVAVAFRSTRRMNVGAELRNDRPTYITAAPVVSVQLRRPNYTPSVATLVPPDR